MCRDGHDSLALGVHSEQLKKKKEKRKKEELPDCSNGAWVATQ